MKLLLIEDLSVVFEGVVVDVVVVAPFATFVTGTTGRKDSPPDDALLDGFVLDAEMLL